LGGGDPMPILWGGIVGGGISRSVGSPGRTRSGRGAGVGSLGSMVGVCALANSSIYRSHRIQITAVARRTTLVIDSSISSPAASHYLLMAGKELAPIGFADAK
jgi:hypothetical protein